MGESQGSIIVMYRNTFIGTIEIKLVLDSEKPLGSYGVF
jgi:hypothetical protein